MSCNSPSYPFKYFKIHFSDYDLSENCNEALLGKKNPDERITSSSSLSPNHVPSNAKLDSPRAWCSATRDISPYIQIRFHYEKLITAIETQGSAYDYSWSRAYDVHYLKKGTWMVYKKVRNFKILGCLTS